MFNLLLGIISALHFFALHVKESVSFPRQLTKPEEQKLIKEMQNGSDEARKKLIEHNLRLVSHIAKKYYSKNNDIDEIISVGTVGLVKGVNSFKEEKNTKLSTYLSKCIQNEILMSFRVQKKSNQDVYFNDPIDFDNEGNPLTLLDVVASEDTIIDKIDLKLKTEKLKEIIYNIKDNREKYVIIKRYGLDGNEPLTQREIAKNLGISRSYVSRIEKKVLEDILNEFNN